MKFDKVEISAPAWRDDRIQGHVCVSGDFGKARINITPAISDAFIRELHAVIIAAAKAGAEDMISIHEARKELDRLEQEAGNE